MTQQNHPLVQSLIERGHALSPLVQPKNRRGERPWDLDLVLSLLPKAKEGETVYHGLRLLGLGQNPREHIAPEQFTQLHAVLLREEEREWQRWRGGWIANAAPRIHLWAALILLGALGPTDRPDEKEWKWFQQWLEYGRECRISCHKVDQACFDTLKSHFRG